MHMDMKSPELENYKYLENQTSHNILDIYQ